MFRYKGFGVWYNDTIKGWMIQAGYSVLHVSPSSSEAKRYISRYLKDFWEE